jgi:hypothetical protein
MTCGGVLQPQPVKQTELNWALDSPMRIHVWEGILCSAPLFSDNSLEYILSDD